MRELLLTYKHEAHITPSVSFSVIPKACKTGSVAFRWTSVHPMVRSACFVLDSLFIYLDCECHTLPESTRISTVLIYECSQSLAIEERCLVGNLTGTYMMKFFHAVIVFFFLAHTHTDSTDRGLHFRDKADPWCQRIAHLGHKITRWSNCDGVKIVIWENCVHKHSLISNWQ